MLQIIPSGTVLKYRGIPVCLVDDTRVDCAGELTSGFSVDEVNRKVTFDSPLIPVRVRRASMFLKWRFKFFQWLTGAEYGSLESLDGQWKLVRKSEMTYGGQVAKPASSAPLADS